MRIGKKFPIWVIKDKAIETGIILLIDQVA